VKKIHSFSGENERLLQITLDVSQSLTHVEEQMINPTTTSSSGTAASTMTASTASTMTASTMTASTMTASTMTEGEF
jgi:hypothetical protein